MKQERQTFIPLKLRPNPFTTTASPLYGTFSGKEGGSDGKEGGSDGNECAYSADGFQETFDLLAA